MSYVSAGVVGVRHRLLLSALASSPDRFRSTIPIRILTPARRTTTRRPARGHAGARSTARTAAWPRPAPRTTPRRAPGRTAARSMARTAAPARSPPTTRRPAATRTAARCGGRTALPATRAGTTRDTGISGTTQPEQQCLWPVGFEHDLGTPNQTDPHPKSKQCAGLGRLVQLEHAARRARRSRAPAATRAGAVKTAGGDVYAGADGNVYKKTDTAGRNTTTARGRRCRQPAGASGQSRVRPGQISPARRKAARHGASVARSASQ